MIVQYRDQLPRGASDFARIITQNNQLTILLACYERGQVSNADLKISAVNISGDLPFYRGIHLDEPGFNQAVKNLEKKYSLLQKEIVFASMRKGAVYMGAFAVFYLCVILWHTRAEK